MKRAGCYQRWSREGLGAGDSGVAQRHLRRAGPHRDAYGAARLPPILPREVPPGDVVGGPPPSAPSSVQGRVFHVPQLSPEGALVFGLKLPSEYREMGSGARFFFNDRFGKSQLSAKGLTGIQF